MNDHVQEYLCILKLSLKEVNLLIVRCDQLLDLIFKTHYLLLRMQGQGPEALELT